MAQRIFRPPTELVDVSRTGLRDKLRATPLASASGPKGEEPSCRSLRIGRHHALRRIATAPIVSINLAERSISSFGGVDHLGESEEPRSGPARTGDLPGDAGQRSVDFPLELETLFGRDHRMSSSMPLADEARSGLIRAVAIELRPARRSRTRRRGPPNVVTSPSTDRRRRFPECDKRRSRHEIPDSMAAARPDEPAAIPVAWR